MSEELFSFSKKKQRSEPLGGGRQQDCCSSGHVRAAEEGGHCSDHLFTNNLHSLKVKWIPEDDENMNVYRIRMMLVFIQQRQKSADC